MGMGMGDLAKAVAEGGWDTAAKNPEDLEALRAQGITPVGDSITRTIPAYAPPTQTSQYANPIPQYQPSRFDFNPYAAAYQQQFNSTPSMPAMQTPQTPTQPVSGLGALAQLYGMYNAAPQDSASQAAHAASITAAANTTI